MSDDEKLIVKGPEPIFEPSSGGLGYETFRSMQLNRHEVAQNFLETGDRNTHGQILERSKRIALYLLSKNLGKEDIVCLCSHNQLHVTIPLFASLFANSKYASLEPTMVDEDLVYLLQLTSPKVLFVAENVEKKVERCLEKANVKAELVIFGRSKNNIQFEDLLKPNPDEEHFQPAFVEDIKETAIIVFSSGTSGKPKGTCLSHYVLLSQMVNSLFLWHKKHYINLSNFKYGEESDGGRRNILSYTPMYWISAVNIVLQAALFGGTATLGRTFDAESCWKAMKKYKPNLMFLPPGQVAELYFERSNDHYDDLDVFVTGGGAVKSIHMDYLREMFPKTFSVQSYGLTENTAIVSTFPIWNPRSKELQLKYPDSCGLVTFGVSCKIVDIETEKICKRNEKGELRIKSIYLLNEYYKMDTSPAYDSDGWFKTGDLGYFNEDDCLIIVDRIKELLLYTIHNISPSVIEVILAQHPSVMESFVIGISHPTDNQHPMGVVLLKKQYQNKVRAEEIVTFVNERVPADKYKLRAGVKFVDEILKTPSGKIKKLAMKELIVQREI